MKINKRRSLRASRQGRIKKIEIERNRQFNLLDELAFYEMETHNMSYWPPFTARQLADFDIEDKAEKLIPNVPHAYTHDYKHHVSFCVFCERPRKAHIHYSNKTFNDLISEIKQMKNSTFLTKTRNRK